MLKRLPGWIHSVVGIGCLGASLWVSPLLRAEELKTIQQRGHLVVAVKDNLRPLGFRDSRGQLQGFEVEIAQRLAQELLGRQDGLVLKPVLNQDRISVLLTGQVDVVVARMTATALRSRLVAFSLPYYLDGASLITRDPSLQRVEQVSDQKIAVLNGSDTAEVVRYRLPRATLIPVASYDAARELLDQGGVTAFAGDASILSGWVQEFPQYRVLSPTLSVEPLCVVVPKGVQYDELRRRINEILSRWYDEGWLQKRAEYWGLP